MINIPIWAFVLLCVGCVPTLIIIVSFIAFLISNGIRDVIDERERR